MRAIPLLLSIFIDGLFVVSFIYVTVLDIISLKFSFQDIKIKTLLLIYSLFYSVYLALSSTLSFLLTQYTVSNISAFVGTIAGVSISLAFTFIILVKPDIPSDISMMPSGMRRICVISIISSALAIDFLLYGSGIQSSEKWNVISKILIILFIATAGSVFPALIVSSIGKEYYYKRNQALQEQLALQAAHYDELAKNNFELRRFKHDYKNMLIGVESLIQEGRAGEAVELLRRGSGAVADGLFQEFDTGNGIVDAILSEKQRKADCVNSVIKFEGAVPSKCLEPTDWCIIFGNTIDNAIEACEKVHLKDKNIINVSCHTTGGFIFVNITNPVKENLTISNNILKTSKKNNNKEHGFGLISLRKIISKYSGKLNLACIDNLFSLNLELEIAA